MTQNEVKKILKEKYVPSSLIITSVHELRMRYLIPMSITDAQILGIGKALHFELFGESGFWIKQKNK